MSIFREGVNLVVITKYTIDKYGFDSIYNNIMKNIYHLDLTEFNYNNLEEEINKADNYDIITCKFESDFGKELPFIKRPKSVKYLIVFYIISDINPSNINSYCIHFNKDKINAYCGLYKMKNIVDVVESAVIFSDKKTKSRFYILKCRNRNTYHDKSTGTCSDLFDFKMYDVRYTFKTDFFDTTEYEEIMHIKAVTTHDAINVCKRVNIEINKRSSIKILNVKEVKISDYKRIESFFDYNKEEL